MSETKNAKRNGGEKRGNSMDRRARKLWILRTWGNGIECPCVWCRKTVTYETMEVDRIIPGASYRRENVQPACRSCNAARSNNTEWTYAA